MVPMPATEFRRNAAECRRLANASSDIEIKDMWVRMARRWVLCADLAKQESLSARRLAGMASH